MPSPNRGRARKGNPLPRLALRLRAAPARAREGLTRREFLGALGAGAAALALPGALAAPASAQRTVAMMGQSNFVHSSPRAFLVDIEQAEPVDDAHHYAADYAADLRELVREIDEPIVWAALLDEPTPDELSNLDSYTQAKTEAGWQTNVVACGHQVFVLAFKRDEPALQSYMASCRISPSWVAASESGKAAEMVEREPPAEFPTELRRSLKRFGSLSRADIATGGGAKA